MVIHQTFADFVVFLYVHMAHADGFFHPNEKQVILHKMTKLYPGETDHEVKLAKVERDYLHRSADEVSIIIQDTFKHFTQVPFAQKYHVYADLYDIVHADGKVEEAEAHMLDALKNIIDMNAAEHKG